MGTKMKILPDAAERKQESAGGAASVAVPTSRRRAAASARTRRLTILTRAKLQVLDMNDDESRQLMVLLPSSALNAIN